LKNNPVAKRYAKALYEIACEKDKVSLVYQELEDILIILTQNQVQSFLLAPEIAKPQKERFLVDSFTDKIHPLVLNFLKLLIHKTRIDLFAQIVAEFKRFVDDHENRLHAKVTSAFPLPDKELDKIKAILGKVTNKNIVLENNIEKSILGGLVIDVAGTRLDSSMKHKIKKMQESLLSADSSRS